MLLSKKVSAAPYNADPERDLWIELKARALRSFGVFVLAFTIAALGYEQIWALVLLKIRGICPELKIVSRSVLGPASLTVSLSAALSCIIGVIWALGELWFFIKPALFPKERRLWRFLGGSFLVLGSLLQYVGFAFAFPYMLSFFLFFNRNIVESSVDLSDLLSFALSLHKGLFFIALWPYILFFLVAQGWISVAGLRKARGFIYIASFFIGMVLTPPDVISQCVLAIPLILLYESALIGLLLLTRSK